MNFQALYFLDTFELVGSLRQRLGLFKGEGGRRVLNLRGPKPNAADPDDDLAYIASREMTRWPELKVALGHVERLAAQVGGVEFGRVFMEMLMPRAHLPWIEETGAYAERFGRAHLALRTNPLAVVFSGTESAHLAAGWLNAVNRRVPCSAINLGETPRVHLVIDFRGVSKAQASDTENNV